MWKSRFGVLSVGATGRDARMNPGAVGWEKNVRGKLGPRVGVADLAPMMDPARYVELCRLVLRRGLTIVFRTGWPIKLSI